MHAQIVLTSSQSKRLIARGILAWAPFGEAFENGIVAVAKGTTNAYIAEELLREAGPKETADEFEKHLYVTGRTAPARGDASWAKSQLPDVVFERGTLRQGATVAAAAAEMGPGDIFLKGANAINYELGQAAVLIGHPTGGTLSSVLGTLVSRKVRLVHPVGLEKEVPGDLTLAAQALSQGGETAGEVYGLWVTQGELFTEIEAIEAAFGLEALPVGAGGIAGAEGSIRLSIFGDQERLEKALSDIRSIQEEGPLGP